jgi:hypothetical protein
MYLVQILLPVFDNKGKPIPHRLHRDVKRELTARFEGLTAYNRSPAEGRWRRGRAVQKEAVIVYEVMVAKREARWWHSYRLELQKRFRQDLVVVRALPMALL